MNWRRLALASAVLAVASLLLAAWSFVELRRLRQAGAATAAAPAASEEPPADRLELRRASFADLPGWDQDRLSQAIPAFVGSCIGKPKESAGGEFAPALAAHADAWKELCRRADALAAGDDAGARAFFQSNFAPWQITNRGDGAGLFTGYYEPELRGARRKKEPYLYPVYLAPRDQLVVDLGDFKRELAGKKIVGMMRGGTFRPYWDRAEIEAGALDGRGLEMLWVDDPIALFFLQIQGSGRVVLPDGGIVRIGYAGQNGHDYTAIGKVLMERGELVREELSLQSIRHWLHTHPEAADEVMRANRSYVFFRVLPGAPVGASGVELTPGRSLAVDPRFLPFGLPLWLASSIPPLPELSKTEETPLERLVVPQDRGGAIRGPVRGDLFWGAGGEAEAIAGRMKQPGRLWLLWPNDLPEPPGAAH